MTFPALAPSSRTFDPGDYPVKAFKAQNGSEFRLLYGSKRVGMKMSLEYTNIPDAAAELFLTHFHAMQGTFRQFSIVAATKSGWAGDQGAIDAERWGSAWRYEGSPQVKSVYPGVSNVRVDLIAATV